MTISVQYIGVYKGESNQYGIFVDGVLKCTGKKDTIFDLAAHILFVWSRKQNVPYPVKEA
jgi:hypothetical protein